MVVFLAVDALKDPAPSRPSPRLPPGRHTPMCLFPFAWSDTIHRQCTRQDRAMPWCATMLSYSHEPLHSVYCTDTIQVPQPNVQPPIMPRGKASPHCLSSFRYKGMEYSGCTAADREMPWCAVMVNEEEEPVASIYCSSCPAIHCGGAVSSTNQEKLQITIVFPTSSSYTALPPRVNLLQIYDTSWLIREFPSYWMSFVLFRWLNLAFDLQADSPSWKLMKWLVTTRMSWWLEDNHLLTQAQYGFRPRHSTFDVLVQMEYHICDTYRQRQEAAPAVEDWVAIWGITVQIDKSAVVCFTLKRIPTPPAVSLNGEPVPFTKHNSFLELRLEGPRLTWASHIDHLSTSCMRQLNVMKRIPSIKWLDTIQNAALRISLGAMQSFSVVSLHAESGVPPLASHRQEVLCHHYHHIRSLPPSHPLSVLYATLGLNHYAPSGSLEPSNPY
ncbi:hypothetical protein E2C01_022815 [Portunus trituberculatus]|uniref:Fibronectin type-II domain-containing protein n=1 Tax=Portunus trituberculatus TaxID=210409 RepID=A0A5B7E9W0_PORTR|nr:hypothetical protein [Portunus trituberculatus]